MESLEPKKLALLRILEILKTYSNIDHPLRQDDILRFLQRDYGISLERKAVGRNLSLLKVGSSGTALNLIACLL